jgi:hypothetical protein
MTDTLAGYIFIFIDNCNPTSCFDIGLLNTIIASKPNDVEINITIYVSTQPPAHEIQEAKLHIISEEQVHMQLCVDVTATAVADFYRRDRRGPTKFIIVPGDYSIQCLTDIIQKRGFTIQVLTSKDVISLV